MIVHGSAAFALMGPHTMSPLSNGPAVGTCTHARQGFTGIITRDLPTAGRVREGDTDFALRSEHEQLERVEIMTSAGVSPMSTDQEYPVEVAAKQPGLDRVVVGVDFSAPSLAAADWVRLHFAPEASSVLVHAIHIPKPPGFLRSSFPSRDEVDRKSVV